MLQVVLLKVQECIRPVFTIMHKGLLLFLLRNGNKDMLESFIVLYLLFAHTLSVPMTPLNHADQLQIRLR